MKIKAYQVAPEYQESPLTVNEGGEHGITIPAAFFRHYGAACESVEMARMEAAKV